MFSFFSNKVLSKLLKKGYKSSDIPPNKTFKLLCDALANGYDADKAANLWDKCLRDNKDSIREMQKNTGLYGLMVFGLLDEEVA